MLERMRNATHGFVGRAIMTLMLGMIIVSFVIWGIGDVFRGFGANNVATVGGTKITSEQFRYAFQTTLQQYQRRLKTGLTNAQAHAFGLDAQTLGRLVADAALDEKARALGLAISDQTIADAVHNDPSLKDAAGKFSRDRFDQALRESGLSERGFVAEQRKTYVRQQIVAALANGVGAPKPLVEALARYDLQARAFDYVVLPPAAAGEIGAPTPEALQTYFNERKDNYRAPEYRAVNVLAVTPTSLAKPSEVSDGDAKARYEKVKAARFTTPEKRKVQQIVFTTEADAAAAAAKIKDGASFEDIAKQRNLTDADIDLGEVTRSEVFDKAIAEAAFSLAAGAVSDVVKGQFGPVLVRASAIAPGSVAPLATVLEQLKTEIAADSAANDVQALHDRIEKVREDGKPLAEAAKSVGLEVRAVDAVDAGGQDKNGTGVDLPEKDALLKAAFASDVGVDNEALSTKDRGFVWFEVTKVETARQRSLEEVKDSLAAQWRDNEIAKRLADKAAAMVKQLGEGAALASAAGPELPIKSAADVHRRGASGLPESVVTVVFNTPPGGAGSATSPDGRVVFKITGDLTPAIDLADAKTKAFQSKTGEALTNDLVSQYINALQRELGVTTNAGALQAAVGG